VPLVFAPYGAPLLPSNCLKGYGVPSVLLAAGLEQVWVILDLLQQDSNIRVEFIHSYGRNITSHFGTQAVARLNADARGALLLGLQMPDQVGGSYYIWAAK